MRDEETPPRRPGDSRAADARLVVTRSIPCDACRYDLHGVPVSSRCPECGLEVRLSVDAIVDPKARRLPQLRNPAGVGDGLLWLTLCLALALVLIVLPELLQRVEAIGGPAFRGFDRPAGLLAATLVLLGLWSAVKLSPPRGAEPRGAVRRDLWLLTAGLAVTAVGLMAAALAIDPRFSRATSDHRLAFMGIALFGAVLVLLALRGIMTTIGQRSREFRNARGGRQRAKDMIAATAGVAIGLALRLVADEWSVEGLEIVGTVMVWISTFMLVIGSGYLVVNAWWIRRSLRRPPPLITEIVGEVADSARVEVANENVDEDTDPDADAGGDAVADGGPRSG